MNRLSDAALNLLLLPVRLLGRLPLRVARILTRPLGPSMRLLMKSRRAVVMRNLALCFPDLQDYKRAEICRAHFGQLADSLAETASAWCRAGRFDQRIGEIVGLEHIK